MKKLVLAALVGASALAVAAPAEAQRWERRGRSVVIQQQAPAINTSTLAVILALSAARRASQSRSVGMQDRSREYVPLK